MKFEDGCIDNTDEKTTDSRNHQDDVRFLLLEGWASSYLTGQSRGVGRLSGNGADAKLL